MKVVAIMGSPRKGQTERMLKQFERELKELIEVEFEYILLREMNLQPCRGCAICLEIGEEKCPLKDDRDLILQKLNDANAIIFATPNYSLQVTGLMKLLFDRLCFIFHRPQFFGKTSMAFITQGVYGSGSIVKYIDEIAGFWGMNVCKGIELTTPWGIRNPNTVYPEAESSKINSQLRKGALRFSKMLKMPVNPSPSMKRMLFFRLTRSAHKHSKVHMRDYDYFQKNGWLEADYYYKTEIGLHKLLFGSLIDRLIGSWTGKE